MSRNVSGVAGFEGASAAGGKQLNWPYTNYD